MEQVQKDQSTRLKRTKDHEAHYDIDGVSQTPSGKIVMASQPVNEKLRSLTNIGIEEVDRKKIAKLVEVMLADTYALYLKTQNFHWNVGGPNFEALHLMFENQYKQLAEAVDVIAERVRALGMPVTATFGYFGTLTTVPDDEAVPKAELMVALLCDGHEMIVRKARDAIPMLEDLHDWATADMINQRIQYHEKTAWMLRSLIA